MSQLSLRAVSKSYGAHKVIGGLSLDADAGEIIVIFGGSGTGKTILLRLIAGVEDPTSGTILLEGRDVTDVAPEHRNVGMAFQNFALFPHMPASENIAAPLRAKGATADAISRGVGKVAKLLKIEHVLNHAPRELSNGQKQRTSLARALAAEPKILLLDDPLRNVDAKLRFEMRLELPRLLRQSGATVLYVTQDYREAMALADRIAVLQGGQFVQLASPEDIYLKPATLQVARLFGDPVINTIETTIRSTGNGTIADIGGTAIALKDSLARLDGKTILLAIRPDMVEMVEGGDTGLSAQVMALTPLNERTVVLLKAVNGWEYLMSLPSSAAVPAPDSIVRTGFGAGGIHLFDKATGLRIDG